MVLSSYDPKTANFVPDTPIALPRLIFQRVLDEDEGKHACNLSGIAILPTPTGTSALIASDEEAAVILAKWLPNEQCWGEAEIFCLSTLLNDPSYKREEADLEVTGLVRRSDGSYDPNLLLAAGSCSAKRKKANVEEYTSEIALDRLGTKIREPNKYFIALIPLNRDATPVAEYDGRKIVKLRRKDFRRLFTELSKDSHFCDYFDKEGPTLPCKYGGFDVEGGFAFEVDGTPNQWDLYLGCRGPVFDQFAVVLHIRVSLTDSGKSLKLVPLHVKDGSKVHYRKILIYSEGAGIRDLACDGDGSVYLLTGPMGNEPAVSNVLQVPAFMALLESSELLHKGVPACLVGKESVYGALTLVSPGFNKPEGLDFFRSSEGDEKFVVITFDSPGQNCFFGHYKLRSH